MHEYIEAEALLQLNDGLDLILECGVVVGVGKLALAVRRTRLADFLGLGEGTDGGSRQLRQAEFLLRLVALGKGRLALDLAGRQLLDARLHRRIVDTLRVSTGAHRAVADVVRLRRFQWALGEGYDFLDFLIGKGEPGGDVGRQLGFCLHGVRHMLQGYGGRHGEGVKASL